MQEKLIEKERKSEGGERV